MVASATRTHHARNYEVVSARGSLAPVPGFAGSYHEFMNSSRNKTAILADDFLISGGPDRIRTGDLLRDRGGVIGQLHYEPTSESTTASETSWPACFFHLPSFLPPSFSYSQVAKPLLWFEKLNKQQRIQKLRP